MERALGCRERERDTVEERRGMQRVCEGETNGRANEERGLWEFVSTTLLSFKQLQCQRGKGDIRGNSSFVCVCVCVFVCVCT